MKQLTMALALVALLAIPAIVSAQDYPSGGGGRGGGGGGMGGGMGGGITVGGGSSGEDENAAGESDVDIVDFAFQPTTSFVDVGTTIDWYNEGAAPHTVTSNTGAFDSGTIGSGGEFSQTFDAAGNQLVPLLDPPNMHGMVIVS